jgi:ABC-type nitrate/sulfonate/bicarbonate transport system permease component
MKRENFWAGKLAPLIGILVFLAIWEAGVRLLKVPAYLMPPPSAP